MSWVKLDDGFADHPKLLGVGQDAFCLHVWALCYAARHLTDGQVPRDAIRGAALVRKPLKAADALLNAGLWVHDGEGFAIHDYLEFNPSREKTLGERAAARERRANGQRTSRDVRPNVARTSADETASVGCPVPSPSRTPKEQPTRAADAAPFSEDFDSIWGLYPRKEARKDALKAFQARRREGIETAELRVALEHYAAYVKGKDREHVMHGSTFFGPNERWKDYLEPSSAAPPAPQRAAWREQADANGPRGCSHCGEGRFLPGSGWVEACACLGGKGSGVAAA